MPTLEEIRRDLHAHPELGYGEHRTRGVIERELTALGIAHVGGVAETGVVAHLPATVPGATRTVALRADMDALPISEETNLPYASSHPGKMHACGHDGHTAMLLGTARELAGGERPNHVLLLFQPAEEGGAGGERMVEAGVLRGEVIGAPAQAIYGLHGFPNLEVGQISTRTGPLMASAAQFRIVVRGRGAHAAYPHVGIDPIVTAAHLITALQTVASRTVDPLDSVVVTIGKVEAGTAHNVIPDEAILDGTLRTLNQATEIRARAVIDHLTEHVARAFGAKAEVRWGEHPYPVTFNDPDAADRLREVLREELGPESVREEAHPSMGGEDFSFYGYEIPACFFFLGLKNSPEHEVPNLHSPRFDFNDQAIPVGVRCLAALARKG